MYQLAYKKLSAQIFSEITKARSVLLCLHAGPDGDSLGSCLAFYHYLTSIGKKVTLIAGDSALPLSFTTLPGGDKILNNNFFDLNLTEFDLFLILDTNGLNQISKLKPIIFPENLKTIIIDHHSTNQSFADLNLVDPSAPATCQLVAQFFIDHKVKLSPEIATCLMLGLYTDTGGYKYPPTSSTTFNIASVLARQAPDYHTALFNFENNDHPERLKLIGYLLSHLKTYFSGHVALASISQTQLIKLGISRESLSSVDLGNMIKAVVGYDIGGTLIEGYDGKVKISLRTRDPGTYHLGQILSSTGFGGGHAAAAGASFPYKLSKSLKTLLTAISQNNPQLGSPWC